MIRNIVFDIGNVLLETDFKGYLNSKIVKEKVEEIFEEMFKSEEWPMLDRGTITEEEAISNIINRNKENERLILCAFDNWYDLLKPIKSSIEILKKLKENGYNIYYLSNFHLKAFEYVTEKYDFFKLFDGGVVSYKEKLLKPEQEIYDMLVNRYNLDKQETVFIDDTKENVKAAINFGVDGIVFKNTDILLDELKKYEIII